MARRRPQDITHK